MLNRRHLRIKVLQILYSYFQDEQRKDLEKLDAELKLSLERMYDMYLYLLLAFEPVVRAANNRIEDRKKKLRPTPEDINPNLAFVENQVFQLLSESSSLQSLAKQRKLSWIGVEHQEMFMNIS